MNDLWYTDLNWYGTALEFVGAAVGILQYVGAEKIKKVADRFNVWNSESFIVVRGFRVPVDRILADWVNSQREFIFVPLTSLRRYFWQYIAIIVTVFAALLSILSWLTPMSPEDNSRFRWLIFVPMIMMALFLIPFILYIFALLIVFLFVLFSLVPQLIVYYAVTFVVFFLNITSAKRELLIGLSIGVALIGLLLQVLSPVLMHFFA